MNTWLYVLLAVKVVVPAAVAVVVNQGMKLLAFGVMRVGHVANTKEPLQVSSVITLASCAEVVAENCESPAFVSALSVFKLEKFVFVTARELVTWSVPRMDVIVLMI